MLSFLERLLDTSGFMPRWRCGQWTASHGWLHIASDLAIFSAYFAIPIALTYFIRRRKDMPLPGIFWLFSAFILCCGIGHAIEASLFWHPWYRLSGLVKFVTAVVSWATVIALLPLLPRALALPGLVGINANLQAVIAKRDQLEGDLRRLNQELEARVQARTTDLTTANRELQTEMQRRRISEERTRQVLDQASDAFVGMNVEGIVTDWNHQSELLFGWSRGEAIGRELAQLIIPPSHREAHRLGMERYLAGGEAHVLGRPVELEALHKDGRAIPVELTIGALEWEGTRLFSAFVRDIRGRQEAARRVLDSLQEKEVLLREIHHRVKNNLAVISSMFYLQSTYTRDEPTLQILRESQDRVRSMALVHESLYRSDSFAAVDFADYALALAQQLVRTYSVTEAVTLRTDIAAVKLSMDLAVPCGLILNELVSNSLKHAFPAGRTGTIRVSLADAGDGRCTLQVRDDGPGLPAHFDAAASATLGLRLIRSLARQIDAVFSLTTDHGETLASLEFTIPNVQAH